MAFYQRIHRYAFDGDLDLLKDLLEKFPDRAKECDTIFGRNVLHYCCIKGNYEIVKHILHRFKGYNVSKRDNCGFTCLHYSCLNGYPKIVEYLLFLDIIDVNDNENRDGSTPLHLCVENERVECFKLLLRFWANPHIRNRKGYTADELTQKNPRMKNEYESFLDGLFDIWEDKTQYGKNRRMVEREQKQIALPFFKYRHSKTVTNGPGIRLVIKRLLSMNDEEHFLRIASNYLSNIHESKWRSVLKTLICFPSKIERITFISNEFSKLVFGKDDVMKLCAVSGYLRILSCCKPDTEYTFDFIQSLFQVKERNKLLFILKELEENCLCMADFDNEKVSLSEMQLSILSSRKKVVVPYLSSKLGISKEEVLRDIRPTVSEYKPSVVESASPKSKGRKKRKKRRRKKKPKRTNESEKVASQAGCRFEELDDILKSNEIFSRIHFSRSIKLALVVGNAEYQHEDLSSLKHRQQEDTSNETDENNKFETKKKKNIGTPEISPEMIQNDCTAITFFLKNKLGFQVTQKLNLTGRKLNLEILRILSLCRSIGEMNLGKPIVLFIYLSGHLLEDRFLGTDFEDRMGHNYLDLKALYCELQESQIHDYDFTYLVVNPSKVSRRSVANNRRSAFTDIGLGIPFQGIVGVSNGMTPTFDGAFSKFSKLLCRYLELYRVPVSSIFKKLRRKKISVEFQSNFGYYDDSEVILTPPQGVSHSEDGVGLEGPASQPSSITLSVPNVGGAAKSDGGVSRYENLEYDVRAARKRNMRVGFIIYHSSLSPPRKFEEDMLDRFKEIIERDYLFSKKCFESKYLELCDDCEREQKKKEKERRIKWQQGRPDGEGQMERKGGPVHPSTRHRTLSSTSSGPKKVSIEDSHPFFTPQMNRRTRKRDFLTSPVMDLRRRPFTKKDTHSIRSRTSSTGKRRTSFKSKEVFQDFKKREESDDDEEENEEQCSVLRTVWVDYPNSILSMGIKKSENILKAIQKLRENESEVIRLADSGDPSPLLLRVFRFFYVLFLENVQRVKEYLNTADDLLKNEEVELLQHQQEQKEEEEGEKEEKEDEDDVDKFQESLSDDHQNISLWNEYAHIVWSRRFLSLIYNYDFHLCGERMLDKLEEIDESINDISEKNGIELLLCEVINEFLKFFEFKYIQNGNLENEKQREEFMRIIQEKNHQVLTHKISSVDCGVFNSRNMSIITAMKKQEMIRHVEMFLSSHIKSYATLKTQFFLVVLDTMFLASYNEDCLYVTSEMDVPVLVGCTSHENKDLVMKKIISSELYVKNYEKFVVVDLSERSDSESDDTDEEKSFLDVSKVRDEIKTVLENGKEENDIDKNWFAEKTRK